MALPGAVKLDRALAKVEQDATDANTTKAAGELVSFTAKRHNPSQRSARTGRVSVRKDRAIARFGSPATPWTVPSHWGHGAPGRPRAQGGWMRPTLFLLRARDEREEEVVDLFLRRTRDVIREVGLS